MISTVQGICIPFIINSMEDIQEGSILIRDARESDVPAIFQLIMELAHFEQAPEKVTNSEQQLREDGFGPDPRYRCFVAERESEIIGIALTYDRYSTWKGRCVYLEDLIVTERYRGSGTGSRLMERCVTFARESGAPLMMWQVLDWNSKAITFYESLGAHLEPEWVNCVLPITSERGTA